MKRNLILIGGIAQALFFLFHLWLGWRLHLAVQIAFPVRGLLEMLNIGGTLCIGFLAYVSLVHGDEMRRTGIGRAATMLALLLYGTRGVGEFIFTAQVQPVIVASCAAMALLYVVVLVAPERAPAVAKA